MLSCVRGCCEVEHYVLIIIKRIIIIIIIIIITRHPTSHMLIQLCQIITQKSYEGTGHKLFYQSTMAHLHMAYCHSQIINPCSYVFTSFSTSFFFVSSVCSLSLLPCCAASALASFWYDTSSFAILSMYAVQSHILTSPYTCPQQ